MRGNSLLFSSSNFRARYFSLFLEACFSFWIASSAVLLYLCCTTRIVASLAFCVWFESVNKGGHENKMGVVVCACVLTMILQFAYVSTSGSVNGFLCAKFWVLVLSFSKRLQEFLLFVYQSVG